ncbi:MAG: (Fe-S)-binding protein [Ilumatobacteraceae bacterium]|nr:(Fe-S)-binding protein [Ilumatobacteraceae bacterium]
MTLHLDDDELSTCVGCGLCLPHCPTYRVTGEEGRSPRGRIDAMRAVQWRSAPIDDRFVEFVDSCVQCRGCEPACPSGVPFGRLMEGTRTELARAGRITPWWQRRGLDALAHHRLVALGSTAIALANRARIVPRRVRMGPLPVRRGPRVASTGTDVWLFTGCVMDAWFRPTHRATVEVLGAMGVGVAVPDPGGCCGALHVHAGLHERAGELATAVMRSLPGDAPVLVNSAGCGAALLDVGHLLDTPDAVAFSARVHDVHEWIAARRDRLPAPARHLGRVIVQDPCHLRHVQRTHAAVREVLAPVADLVELDDDGLCCGAGGAFSALHPDLAASIRARKLASIERARHTGDIAAVASANPGCAMHLAAAGVPVRHPMDLLAEALR